MIVANIRVDRFMEYSKQSCFTTRLTSSNISECHIVQFDWPYIVFFIIPKCRNVTHGNEYNNGKF